MTIRHPGDFTLLYTTSSFAAHISPPCPRHIHNIQIHHTYQPDHTAWTKKPDHLHWLNSMESYHIKTRGFKQIAQHFTVFPDGVIASCRQISQSPAGIIGHNQHGICIEILGNFDKGHDLITPEQAHSLESAVALLLNRFKLKPSTETILYHHWHASKSCPGSAFYGGNDRKSATDHFIPLIAQKMEILS